MLNQQQDIKKPIPCNQNWNEMLPTDGGRICLGCGKLVSDFRKSSWADIAKVHSKSPIPVCGIYSKEQINSWGQNISIHQSSCSKLVAISAALLALAQLSPTPLKAQKTVAQEQTQTSKQLLKQKPTNAKPKQKFVSGTVVVLQSDSTKLPLKDASIFVLQDSLHLKTVTDSVGRFVLDITNRFSKLPNTITLILSHPDFMTKSIPLNKNNLKVLDLTFSQIIIESNKVPLISHGAAFYVAEIEEPTKQPENKWWLFWKRKTK